MSEEAAAERMRFIMELAKRTSPEEKLYRYNGVLYPRVLCPEHHLNNLINLKAREDDIMLFAYPKCGSNWMMAVLRKIITAATGVQTENGLAPLMEFFTPDFLKLMDAAPTPRFIGTHMHPDLIPASFQEKRTKKLVIFRNPKDTLVSYYHFSNNNPVLSSGQSWETFFSNFMSGDVPWGSYFDYALAWEKRMDDPDIMITTYEELKQDLTKGIHDISSFFELSLTKAQVQQISEGSTFIAMKQNSANTHADMGSVFFRKGVIGDWKNHFTPEQSQEMDEAFNNHLAGTRLGVKLDYQRYCL